MLRLRLPLASWQYLRWSSHTLASTADNCMTINYHVVCKYQAYNCTAIITSLWAKFHRLQANSSASQVYSLGYLPLSLGPMIIGESARKLGKLVFHRGKLLPFLYGTVCLPVWKRSLIRLCRGMRQSSEYVQQCSSVIVYSISQFNAKRPETFQSNLNSAINIFKSTQYFQGLFIPK